ncbi:group 1 truncated hemoglobin [Robiginitalea sp. SC105]|uniref:group I truncated hemoglobin n=1 Tax=Robiginitalea sp. SC105 TaxID=2762332 RepID=UPI00163A1F9A|nr:group 1 truncated hemoglobin [Robiginitalea sp. SC105]MBC2839841.1 group 1 truncated hemoglobin [Robiginitalea sp. SC105]
METTNQKSLYERLGGASGIEALVDDIIELHMTNPVVKARFLPLKDDPNHFAEVRQHLINFLASGSGGPEEYTGMDMPTAHRGMNISVSEYYNVVDDIMSALDKHHIDEQSKKDVLYIAYSLKDTMIGL